MELILLLMPHLIESIKVQQPFFDAVQLADIARSLDDIERERMKEAGKISHNHITLK